MFLRKKIVAICLSSIALVSFANKSYSDDNIPQIVKAVEALCKAPTGKKSIYYKITGKAKSSVRVKFFALAKGGVDFKKEEWNGIQRVLRADQAKDNDSYRNCSTKLTPIFIEKFYKIRSPQQTIAKNTKKKIKKQTTNNPSINSAVTHGKNSPIIGTVKGNITFNNN